MKLQKPVYFIDGLRSPIAVPFKSLKSFTVAQMAAVVMTEILDRNGIPRDWVKEIILGNAVLAGSGQNFARQAAFLSGLPTATHAVKTTTPTTAVAGARAHRSDLDQGTGRIRGRRTRFLRHSQTIPPAAIAPIPIPTERVGD